MSPSSERLALRHTTALRVRRWWRGEAGAWGRVLDIVLAPAELAFRGAVHLYHAAYDAGALRAQRLPVPVVSVGNLAVGGSGKTPVARWLAEELAQRGARVGLVHGDYAADEPALHALWNADLLVLGARDRVRAAQEAVRRGATAVVLDDGFQHRGLARDLDVVLLAAEHGARWRLLPRGPGREPLSAARRAHAVIVTRKTATHGAAQELAARAARAAPDAAMAIAHLRPCGWRRWQAGRVSDGSPSGRALALAGVAEPELFFENAREAGAEIARAVPLPDHYTYSAADAARIRNWSAGRPVVTTTKDAVKLAPLLPDLELWTLEQQLQVELGMETLMRLLDELMQTSPVTTPGRRR